MCTSSGFLPSLCPHAEQIWLLGYQRSITVSVRPYHILLDAVDDTRPVRIQQALRPAGAGKSFDVEGFQGDGLVLARHLGCQFVRHVLALVLYPAVGLGSQDSCLCMIGRAFLFPCQLFVEPA